MKKAATLLIILVSVKAHALTFMGPPTSDMGRGQFGLGFDYAHTDADLDTYFARLVFGVADRAEVAGRLGFSDIDNGDQDIAWGMASKITIAPSEAVDWGFLFQMTVFSWQEVWAFSMPGGYGYMVADIDVYEFRGALGPSVKMGDLSLYGGPMVIYIAGDVEDDSEFGGYAGLSWQIDGNTSLAAEYQITEDVETVGVGLLYKFGPSSRARNRARRSRGTGVWSPVRRRRPAPPKKPVVRDELLTDESGQPVTDKDGNFIFVPVE